MGNVTINNEQKLYVIPCGNGFSTFGFEHLFNYRAKIAKELNLPQYATAELGTIEVYNEYIHLTSIASNSGKKLEAGLNEKLKGLEGKRVEVEYTWGEKERFYVGRSTGWIPCHLMIKQKNSNGGGACLGDDSIKSVKVVHQK